MGNKMSAYRNWTVLIVGGASGTGKSEFAYNIGSHFGISVLEFDDIHLSIEDYCTVETHPYICDPEGHLWREKGVEWNVEWLKGVSREMMPTLTKLVTRHVEEGVPVIIEGDFITPETVSLFTSDKVKVVFLIEKDMTQIISNHTSRENNGEDYYRAEISASYNNWILEECSKIGITTLNARPWDTAVDRFLQIKHIVTKRDDDYKPNIPYIKRIDETDMVSCFLSQLLDEDNRQKGITYSGTSIPLSFAIYENGAMVAGVSGDQVVHGFHIKMLAVMPPFQKRGYGIMLMQHIEQEAIARGVKIFTVSTQDYQALGFYKKLGYEVFGELREWPTIDTVKYYLRKYVC